MRAKRVVGDRFFAYFMILLSIAAMSFLLNFMTLFIFNLKHHIVYLKVDENLFRIVVYHLFYYSALMLCVSSSVVCSWCHFEIGSFGSFLSLLMVLFAFSSWSNGKWEKARNTNTEFIFLNVFIANMTKGKLLKRLLSTPWSVRISLSLVSLSWQAHFHVVHYFHNHSTCIVCCAGVIVFRLGNV